MATTIPKPGVAADFDNMQLARDIIAAVIQLAAAVDTLAAKLNADSGVDDTDYAETNETAVATYLSLGS